MQIGDLVRLNRHTYKAVDNSEPDFGLCVGRIVQLDADQLAIQLREPREGDDPYFAEVLEGYDRTLYWNESDVEGAAGGCESFWRGYAAAICHPWADDPDYKALAENALNGAVQSIQTALGVHFGDFAGDYFSGGEKWGDAVEILEDYACAEREFRRGDPDFARPMGVPK